MRRVLVAPSLPWKRLLADFTVIVAGVLIALAVNSWWERHEERKRAEEYLEQLLVDFQQTERRLAGAIEGDTRMLQRVDSVVVRALHGPLPPADSLQFPTGYNQFEPLVGTLNALVEGGDLRLLRNDSIRFELIAYSSLLAQTDISLRHTENLVWRSTERVALGRARHSVTAPRGEANGGGRWGEVDVAGALSDPEVVSALQVQGAASQMRLFTLRRLERPTRRIISLIEAELN